MKEWSEDMSCSKEEHDRLNKLVEDINDHLGDKVFRLESAEGYETECVNIMLEGAATYTSFEGAIVYLEGVLDGVLLKEEYNV